MRLLDGLVRYRLGTIGNAALTWAFFDVYLGDKPSPSASKKTVIARLPEILRES